jgi:exodeoxyribonuclease I
MGFVFYDTETTGTDTSFDQILQFAAIHTDDQLNELERFEIRCRLLPYVVPAPGAMRVTRVQARQLFDPSLPSHYEMVRRIREKFIAWSPALFVGYNSIAFDEHLIRQALYKTLHPPYLTNTNGNARTDALRMARAASLFAPHSIVVPDLDDGSCSFKLDRLAPANGFAHENAHDALADVEATIFLCLRIAENAPEVWSAFMRFSQKAAVTDYIASESVFCLSDFYFGNPYSWLVTNLGCNPEIGTELFVFDLAVDPVDLAPLSDEQLIERLEQWPKPVRRLKSNACPVIMPPEDAPAIARASQLSLEELARRAEVLRSDDEFRARLIKLRLSMRAEFEKSVHVEQQIYDGFFTAGDQQRLESFHLVPWEERPPIIEAFEDGRLKTIGRRLLYSERPDLLAAAERARYELHIAKRLLHSGEVPWLTLPQALSEIDELMAAADSVEHELLRHHKAHLVDRHDRAVEALRSASDLEAA